MPVAAEAADRPRERPRPPRRGRARRERPPRPRRPRSQPAGSRRQAAGAGRAKSRPAPAAAAQARPRPPRPHPADALLAKLAYVIVNEAGASVYSTSPVGREEFPDFDATLRGTISIGRRLQDPLAELVKIEPQNIGVGLYQHDVNAKQLKESLEAVISSCVNFVGVDLNTASVPLLRHVSGLNQLTARRVVDHRKEKGPFTDRAAVAARSRGSARRRSPRPPASSRSATARTRSTGPGSTPRATPVATRLLEKLGFTPRGRPRQASSSPRCTPSSTRLDLPALAHELEVGEPTLRDICDALARPDRDPRDDLPKPIFKKGVLKLEDLQPGMELKGTVLNVVDFGAFVDIGLKDSGLVHISQLANRYIKSPHDVVSVGDVVTAWVMGVDHERKRVSLTMVKPGTERPRGGPAAAAAAVAVAAVGERESASPAATARRPAPAASPRREPCPASAAGGTAARVGHCPGGFGGEATAASRPPRRPRPRRPRRRPRPGGGDGRTAAARPAPPHGGPGSGPARAAERTPPPRPPARPSKPGPHRPPCPRTPSQGSVPLRTFGQLKQLWQARRVRPRNRGTR